MDEILLKVGLQGRPIFEWSNGSPEDKPFYSVEIKRKDRKSPGDSERWMCDGVALDSAGIHITYYDGFKGRVIRSWTHDEIEQIDIRPLTKKPFKPLGLYEQPIAYRLDTLGRWPEDVRGDDDSGQITE